MEQIVGRRVLGNRKRKISSFHSWECDSNKNEIVERAGGGSVCRDGDSLECDVDAVNVAQGNALRAEISSCRTNNEISKPQTTEAADHVAGMEQLS